MAAPSMSPHDPIGLPEYEAAKILLLDGPNELPQDQGRSVGRIMIDALREPMLQLLLAAGLIYLIIGDLAEALILVAFAVLNVVLVVIQESRTEAALAALKDLTGVFALVIRDGQRRQIAAKSLVVGDLIVLTEGSRVPADGQLVQISDLETDESLLTGESLPVRKVICADIDAKARPGGTDSANIWSGSLVIRGTGLACVTATGLKTEIGKIGTSLNAVDNAATPLQSQMRRLVVVFTVLGIGSSVILSIAFGFLHGDWIKGLLAGITLAMATLPEEFPLVLTIFLVLGAWRMAQHKVLTRRSSSVEALGAVRVLCTDKTGTLTQNRMMVSDLIADGTQVSVTEIGPTDLPDPIHRLVEWAILASRVNPFDPMERAFNALGQRFLSNTEHLHADWTLIRLYPLQSNLLAMSQLWQRPGSTDYQVAAKGAPEAIAGLCHLSEAQLVSIRRDVERLAQQGRRVLGVAQAIWSGAQAPLVQSDIDFQFIGLVGLADPIRPEVPAAVATCAKAGIRVVMITGDHPGTALAIAHQAGIATAGVLTGDEISRMDKKTLADRLRQTNVFARIMPEQKLLLVTAFSAAGDVVAMTGDGVNDAPSLKAAHIGVAMGQRGTDVAREAASLVLLDDNFASLIDAIRLGRRIDDNLRKAISYILAVHVPIAGMSLVPVLLGWPIILGPIHVVFLELIIDPVSSIVFEAESAEPGIMERPPRAPGAPLFTTELLLHGLIQGSVVLAATLGIFFLGLRDIHGTEVSRCMAFVTLVIGNLGLVLTNRSIHKSAFAVLFQPNPALLVVAAITAAALSLALSLSWLRELFGFAALSFSQLGEALGAAIAATIFNDLTGIAWGLLAKRNGSHKDSL